MKPGEVRTVGELAAAASDLLVRADGAGDISIHGIAFDSRRVSPGDLFFCVPGSVVDGHRFASEAVASGAVALCVERPTGSEAAEIVVSDARRAMGRIASAFYGRPADALCMLGVTGTNGKTTTVFLLESILAAAGRRPGLIGTIHTRWGDRTLPGVRTTPESADLHELLAEMRAGGVDSVAMEVTSHGLVLDRIEGVQFEACAFTNLSQDHLDFHKGMEDYFEAKRSLFVPARTRSAAVNVDDSYGRRLIEHPRVDTISFGLSIDAVVRAEDIEMGAHGSRFVLTSNRGSVKIETALAGAFNISNCLAAAATALQADFGLDAIEQGLTTLRAVPGRFESVDEGQPFAVIVDYAHTPDSLQNVLRAARELTSNATGRLICVFGCGGDRDRAKRPLMGETAAELADYVVVTSDNPRSEDPQSIIDAILPGVRSRRPDGPDAVFVDRAGAITHALDVARVGDAVVIAGKGHETGQEFVDRTVPFDDRAVARAALADMGWPV